MLIHFLERPMKSRFTLASGASNDGRNNCMESKSINQSTTTKTAITRRSRPMSSARSRTCSSLNLSSRLGIGAWAADTHRVCCRPEPLDHEVPAPPVASSIFLLPWPLGYGWNNTPGPLSVGIVARRRARLTTVDPNYYLPHLQDCCLPRVSAPRYW